MLPFMIDWETQFQINETLSLPEIARVVNAQVTGNFDEGLDFLNRYLEVRGDDINALGMLGAESSLAVLAGRDPQLERAVEEVLKAIEAEPRRLPTRPEPPVKTP